MHHPADMSLWQGRVDPEEGERARRWHQCVEALPPGGEPPGIALLGVCSDEGVRRNMGRSGARLGPDAIRRGLAGQALHLRRRLYDAGNLICENHDLESLQLEQAGRVEDMLGRGHFPLLLGGGHEMAYGSFLGLSRHLEKAGEGIPNIVNFDAHFDLRPAPPATSGTPFSQMAAYCREGGKDFRYLCLGVSEAANTAALFDRAADLGVKWIPDEEMTPWNLPKMEEELLAFLDNGAPVHLSIDLDVLPAAVAPGVSAPAPRGISLEVLEHLLRLLRTGAGARLRLAEIAEYNPEFDIDGRTARVAARLCHLLTRG